MRTIAGDEFIVGFGGETIGLAVNPPPVNDGTTPIPYLDLTPAEAEQLASLLIENAKMSRVIRLAL